MWIIYCATYKDGRCYVGQTKRHLIDRIYSHWGCPNSKFGAFYRATDPNDWKWETLKEVETIEEAFHWEAFYIAEKKGYLTGFNSPSGQKPKITDQTRKKMSEAKVGRVPWNKGRKNVYSEESLKLFQIAALNRRRAKRTQEWNDNQRKAIQEKYGRKVINLDTGEEFNSVAETSRKLNLASSTVKRILNGTIKDGIVKLKYKH